MGVDIYLQSIWKPFAETFSPPKPTAPLENAADAVAFLTGRFDAMRASGGYFRNGYNSGDVMRAMGMSWHDTVYPMLDDQGHLPIERARELIAMIEARPLTREQVATHLLKNFTSGHWVRPSDHDAILEATAGQTGPKAEPDFDHLSGFLNARRDELLAILRKSVELDEPLICD
jgi:hypothetical protein